MWRELEHNNMWRNTTTPVFSWAGRCRRPADDKLTANASSFVRFYCLHVTSAQTAKHQHLLWACWLETSVHIAVPNIASASWHQRTLPRHCGAVQRPREVWCPLKTSMTSSSKWVAKWTSNVAWKGLLENEIRTSDPTTANDCFSVWLLSESETIKVRITSIF